ncbi:hypothetical protein C0992_007770 [Termitomyces sp. T32_za158]|nr:hypothetical protein C0992_007770 [Termitomyces sp. T32_za158]
MAIEPSQSSSSRTHIPPLTTEEEDQVILARIANDDRPLKRVIKKFHNYTSLSHAPLVPSIGNTVDQSLTDAREAFLVELATFQLSLKKSAMICEAEARQVEEYQRERQTIVREHAVLRDQIDQLKAALEEAQIVRRRKIEYDLVAEKVNTLPSREELEQYVTFCTRGCQTYRKSRSSIESLESDMAAIRTEHETHSQTLFDQKSSLDSIIAQLDYLRFMGKDKDEASLGTSRVPTPAPDSAGTDVIEDSPEAAPIPTEVPHNEREEGEHGKGTPESTEASGIGADEDDIEMGEVEEDPKPKKKMREELEEGEASDASSALSDPPDDI